MPSPRHLETASKRYLGLAGLSKCSLVKRIMHLQLQGQSLIPRFTEQTNVTLLLNFLVNQYVAAKENLT